MGKEKVVDVTKITRDEWARVFRKTGCGGSDAATIAGLNPFSSRYALWCDKVGITPPKEDNEIMRQGRDLEDYVARRWCEATGKRVRRNNFMWRSVESPWMIADVDREVVGENAGLECKTTSVYNKADLDAGEIPINYLVQCYHYMYTMGWERCYLAILVLSKGFYHFVIERDEAEIAALVEMERDFWGYVERRQPPETDGSDATAAAISKRYPAGSVVDDDADFSERASNAIVALAAIDEQIKVLNAEKKAAQAIIQEEMGECSRGNAGGYHITWKAQSRTTLDSKAIKAEMPEVWERYARTSETRVFKYKKGDND